RTLLMNTSVLSKSMPSLTSIDRLIDETLGSLLHSFDKEERRFYTSPLEGRGVSRPTWRDSALALAAIASAQLAMDREERKDDDSETDVFRTRPIRYRVYQRLYFEPCLERIATGIPDKILGKEERDVEKIRVFDHRDPFTCARILGLLNLYGRQ